MSEKPALSLMGRSRPIRAQSRAWARQSFSWKLLMSVPSRCDLQTKRPRAAFTRKLNRRRKYRRAQR